MARGKGKKGFLPFDLGSAVKASLLVAGGVVAGYCWRSYLPLALPVESPLVADSSSYDLKANSLQEVAKAAEKQVAALEAERDRLKERVEELEQVKTQKDAEIGDLAIKSVLGGK